jgi:hypothetical protein
VPRLAQSTPQEMRDRPKHVSSPEGKRDPLLPEGFSRLQYHIALIVVTFEFTFGKGAGIVGLLMLLALAGVVGLTLAVAVPGLDSQTVGLILAGIAFLFFNIFWAVWIPINRKSAGDAVRWNVAHESPEQRSYRRKVVALLVVSWGTAVASCVLWAITHGW